MKYHHIEEDQDQPNWKKTPKLNKKPIFLILFFITLTTLPIYLRNNTSFTALFSLFPTNVTPTRACNLFNGTWVPHSDQPPHYYTNQTCKLMIDEMNCFKFGRPDTDFLKWRWKPDQCELPFFNATLFLHLVRNKSMAFLGDSVGKNQLYSLVCLLSQADNNTEDLSEMHPSHSPYFRRYRFPNYNFTVGTLWAPYLVRSEESDPSGYSRNSLMNLYLDEPSPGWVPEVEDFDIVVVSAGQWFFRQVMLYLNRTLIGCSNCHLANVTDLRHFYVYRQAYRTVFRSLIGLPNYWGVTILRTFSPAHFENGEWNTGGSCLRTKPFGREVELPWYIAEMRRMQVEEFEAARAVAEGKGMRFMLMDTTAAMYMRPDGHPNYYSQSPGRNMSYADCVHWCLPGPVDAWNEILLYLLRNVTELEIVI